MRWPQRQPTYAELCCVAGLFEGEGSFNTGQIRIPQKDREVLDRARRLVGGRVACYQHRSQVAPPGPMFVWYATGPRGRGIARTIFRLLSERRRAQARRFLNISRVEDPPILDPSDPARLLWDWAPDGEAE